ncbi:MAG: hypothetical protein AAGH15_12000, partial [Myxococcota bacterium]
LAAALLGDVEAALAPLGALRAAVPREAIGPLASALELLASALVEREPSVREARAAVEDAIRWGRQADFYAGSEVYDARHAELHGELADAVRARLSADAVRVALRGLDPHPYR